MISWNINGTYTKLEKENIIQLLTNYDVISFNEVKANSRIAFPGYVTYRSKVCGSAERGGTVVCVRNSLSHLVTFVDLSIDDQVWLQLGNMQGILFGFCYIAPCDSPYYSHASFAAIQEKLYSNYMSRGYFLMGDMNCRFGNSVRDLLAHIKSSDLNQYTYPVVSDNVSVANDNAAIMSTICTDNDLLVVNNLRTFDKHFVSDKTYRKKGTWISELDTCIVSQNLVRCINDFSVVRQSGLPSDHAPIAVTVTTDVDLDSILMRAKSLGDYSALCGDVGKHKLTKKSVKFSNMDTCKFKNDIAQIEVFDDNDVNVLASNVTDALYTCAVKSVSRVRSEGYSNDNLGRWEKLLGDGDDARVWKAIDWRGNVTMSGYGGDICPNDEEFKAHFESVLNPPVTLDPYLGDIATDVTIPILDDPILPAEVHEQIRKLKPDKACGPDGLSPGIFSLLPAQWVLTLVTLFNRIFCCGQYPVSWIRAKIFTIFKKGNKTDPHNYRGISVTNAIAKLYDMVLCERLYQWFRPFREQAGAQRKRGCTEHIVTLRLLTDTARRKKIKLFVTFIDFSKAYDLVPRHKLFTVMKNIGCGMVMLMAVMSMYCVTESIVGSSVVTATVGVRQGLSTSCFLFIIFVNDLIKSIKQKCQHEPFLEWLHILMLVDDTVLLSTNRENMIKKLQILQDFCHGYGMKINTCKTKFFVIHGEEGDADPLQVDGLVVDHCRSYVYLGSPFTCDGSVSSAVKEHARSKMCHVLKFVSFIKKNNDVPFIVKRRVFDAALMSSLLYGCESWVGANIKPVVKLYNWALKELLGVRRTTPNLVCYAELGYPSLTDLLKYRQHKFFNKMWCERSNMVDDPLSFSINTVIDANSPVGKIVRDMIHNNVPKMSDLLVNVHNAITTSDASRCNVYKVINPGFVVHEVYTKKHTINDLQRKSFTRFRVCGHNLAVETGRWNRRGRGRLPMEERLCVCGLVQTEWHVIEECPDTQYFRDFYGITSLNEMFSNLSSDVVCRAIHDILRVFE